LVDSGEQAESTTNPVWSNLESLKRYPEKVKGIEYWMDLYILKGNSDSWGEFGNRVVLST